MKIRQAIALSLSTDLHAAAKILTDADDGLAEVREEIQACLRAAPPDLRGQGIYAFLDAVLDQVIEVEALVIETRAALTGRSPRAILKDPHNPG